eukprot:jgi/Bigna1/134412/aug1.25_g9120
MKLLIPRADSLLDKIGKVIPCSKMILNIPQFCVASKATRRLPLMTGLQRFIRPQRFCPIRPGAGYKNHILDRCRIIAGQRLLCTEAEADGAEKQGERRPKPPKYTKVELPQLMETMKTGTIEEWKIAEGSAIEVNMDLCLIDTEMAQFYLHAPCDGVLAKIIAKEGEEVEVGGTVASIMLGDGDGRKEGRWRGMGLVEKWLLGLQFDPDTVVSKLKHYKGKDLLRLKKEDAEHYFGLEGIRLVNEIEDLLSSLSAASKEDASSPSS